FRVFDGAIDQTHSSGVVKIETPSEVSTVQPPTPPTKTSAPSIEIDTADKPGNAKFEDVNILKNKSSRLYSFPISLLML
ncbi:jg24693, partial [Pararge aegeria aegeria]